MKTICFHHEEALGRIIKSRLSRVQALFLREMAPPGRGCVVRTFGLVSVSLYFMTFSPPFPLTARWELCRDAFFRWIEWYACHNADTPSVQESFAWADHVGDDV